MLESLWGWDHLQPVLEGNDRMFLSSVFMRLAIVSQSGLVRDLHPVTRSLEGWSRIVRPSSCILLVVSGMAGLVVRFTDPW